MRSGCVDMVSHVVSASSTPAGTRVGVCSDRITELGPDDVFVFGSNLRGFHGAGSAGFAMRGTSRNDWRSDVAFLDILNGHNPDRRGLWAEFGVGRGYQVGRKGRSYAIATVERPGLQGCVTLEHLYEQLGAFVEFAKEHPELRFLVVKLGATRAEGGYSYFGLGVVAKLWEKLHREVGIPGNIVLPECFVPKCPGCGEDLVLRDVFSGGVRWAECIECETIVDESVEDFPDDEPETGTCEHCKRSEVPVEFDLDMFLCEYCRRMLYTQGSRDEEVKEETPTKCSCCSEELDFEFYNSSNDPMAKKVAWDMNRFKLCEGCLTISIIGYDHMDCEFQNLSHCKNPQHPGDLCLGYACPYKKHEPKPSLLSDLRKEEGEKCADCGAPEDESIKFGGFDRPLCLSCRGKEMKRIDAGDIARYGKEESQ